MVPPVDEELGDEELVDEELVMVRQTVRSLLEATCGVGRADDGVEWRGLWGTITRAGWTGIGLPPGDTRQGLGASGVVALFEEAGRYLVPAPLLSTAGLFVPLVAGAGGDAAVDLLEPAVRDGRPAGIALPPDDRLDAPADAGARWDGQTLSASGFLVMDADRIELVAVPATGPDGEPVVAVVDMGTAGLEMLPCRGADPDRPLARMDLQAELEPRWIVGADPARGFEGAVLAVAAELVGIAQRCLELSARHAMERVQFGRPIGSFQSIKHRLADDAVATEEARSLVRAAAQAVDAMDGAGARGRWRSVSMAKAAASEAATNAAASAVQVHGALAMSWDHPIHRHLRRAWLDSALLGGPTQHYQSVAESLMGQR